jgi:site-specific recombinase XerD
VISAYTAELKYIRNVSPTTLDLYKYSFQAFKDALESRATVVARVAELRDKGMKPVTVNTYLRCINAYFMWLHKEHGKERVKIPWLQDEQKILITFSARQGAHTLEARQACGSAASHACPYSP